MLKGENDTTEYGNYNQMSYRTPWSFTKRFWNVLCEMRTVTKARRSESGKKERRKIQGSFVPKNARMVPEMAGAGGCPCVMFRDNSSGVGWSDKRRYFSKYKVIFGN